MRQALIVIVLLGLAGQAAADACRTIRWKSWGKITCYKQENTGVLIYDAPWVFKRVIDSGKHNHMRTVLCAEEGVQQVREVVLKGGGEVVTTTQCTSLIDNKSNGVIVAREDG